MPLTTNPPAPEALKEIPFFASFSVEQLSQVAAASIMAVFPSGQALLKQGFPSKFLYLILTGSVKVQREDSAGSVYALGELGVGQICGELPLLRGEPSRAAVIAVADTTLLALSRAALLKIIRLAAPEQILDMFFALDEQTRVSSERGFRETLSRRVLASQVEVEKQRALTQMAASVAHEINTPLGVINAAVNLMARELATAPREMTAQRAAEIAESLELMRLSVERADRLTQGFKNVSVSQLNDEKGVFDVAEVVEETINLIAVRLKQSQVRVKFDCQLREEEKPWVGYRGLLSQILINLLTNVERYAYPNGIGGVAEVTLRLKDGENFLLTVCDHGRGISAENQGRLFEPFFTTGKAIGGSGLGLSIIHNIAVNTLKGNIRVKSVEGEGAEFTVTFPREIK